MAARELGCHWQTLLNRERKGELTPIKIGRKKFYAIGQVRQIKKYRPVQTKPHWSKRKPAAGGGPGSGEILINNQPAVIVRVQPEQPKQSLWTKIKSLFSVFAAK